MDHETTTAVRVSRGTQRVLRELAAARGRSVSDLVEQLAERARREQLLVQYAERMAQLSREPAEQAGLDEDRVWLEASAGHTLTGEPYPEKDEHARTAR